MRAGDAVFCANSAPCGACRQCARGRESLCEDLLYLLGGFAEKLLVPERVVRTNLHRLPGACRSRSRRWPSRSRARSTRSTSSSSPDRVTILGAGSLGCMLAALVAGAGVQPLVLDPHPERLALAERFGARTATRHQGPEDIARGSAELVIEAVGRPEAWELAVRWPSPAAP